MKVLICAVVLIWTSMSCEAQTQTGGAVKQVVQRQVAPDLYFLCDETSSNSAFLTTDEGVLIVDTRQHPRDGQDLLERIRKITDKPIKWVVNTHFHGDHTYGNSVFKELGANIVAHEDTARIMAQVASKEFARRRPFFEARHYDPGEVKLTLPNLTFSKDLTIYLGGREVHLAYRGPGQNPGDTFVFFPHARAVFTSGAFGKRSMPNMNFTPSPQNWIELLKDLAKENVDVVMPPHGDLATRADVTDLAAFIDYEYEAVKKAVADGVPLETAVGTLDFSAYRDWHNYTRRQNDIKGLYELIQTGQRSYFR